MGYSRSFEITLRSRLQEISPLIQVIVGPRQVGKSTAIRQALAGRGVYESADSPTPLTHEVIGEWWVRAQAAADAILAIDEVQKIQGWSEAIKKLWDQQPLRGKTVKVILSGSAALSIERNLRESLAGRFELIRAEHWNFSEARSLFGMELRQFIEMGCYPGSMSLASDLERWAGYVRDSIIEPVIGRDVLQLHPVQNPALLRQVFGVAASLPAQIVSLHKLQGQLQDRGAVATLQHYLDLLSQGFMLSSLEKFTTAPLRSKRSSPKLVIHDNALIRALERPVVRALDPARLGRYFENAVAARLLESGWETYYWNDRKLEVDLVAIGASGERLAIEVKSSRIDPATLHGLRVFCSRHSGFTPCLASLVGQEVEGLRSLPVETLLSLSRERPNLP